MTRRKAWYLAAIVTASVVSLVVALGATFGWFGFGASGSGALAARGPTVTATAELAGQRSTGQAVDLQDYDAYEGIDDDRHEDDEDHDDDDDQDEDDDDERGEREYDGQDGKRGRDHEEDD